MSTQTKREMRKLSWGLFGAVPLTVALAMIPRHNYHNQQRMQQPAPYAAAISEKPVRNESIYFQPDRILQSADYRKGRTKTLDTIVLHTTEGSAEGAIQHLTSPAAPKVSAHYVVAEGGEIVQLVSPNDTAYHVRGWNPRSVGIEFEGNYNKLLTSQQVRRGAELISFLQREYGPLQIKPHSELDPSRRKDPGEANYKAILNAVKNDQLNR